MYGITIASIALLVTSVAAQGTSGLPSCVSSCVGSSFWQLWDSGRQMHL